MMFFTLIHFQISLPIELNCHLHQISIDCPFDAVPYFALQVSTWFANARRRLKKENKMTWSPRNRSEDGEEDGDKANDDGDHITKEDVDALDNILEDQSEGKDADEEVKDDDSDVVDVEVDAGRRNADEEEIRERIRLGERMHDHPEKHGNYHRL